MDKSVVKIEPATPAHVTALYGHPLRQTVRGFAGIYEDAPVVLCAIYCEDGRQILTFKVAPEAREAMRHHVKPILRATKALLASAAKTKLPMQTVVDRQYPRARELVEHLGFRHLEKDVYQWQT